MKTILITCFFMTVMCISELYSVTGINKNKTSESRTYYIDSRLGKDENSGLSPEKPWRSFINLKNVKFNPGDQLLLKRGERFVGELEVSAKGTPAKKIIIGAYGEAKQKPCIVGHDKSMYAMRIYNSEYLIVQDIEIVNTGSKPQPRRTGLKVECNNYGISRNITVNNLTIRDVNGSRVKAEGGGSGIHIVNTGKEIKSRFDSLVIENCHIIRCERNAIIWSGYYDRKNWYPSKHTIVRNNLIEGVPGDGIVPIGCDSTLIEYNVMRGCPDVLPAKEAAAGIWPWSCDNTIIQFNEVSDHKAPWDAQGFDADYNCNNTVIQYNYSHDNYGGMVLICDSGNERNYSIGNNNSVIRYNISIGDGIRPKATHAGMFSPSIHIAGRVKNTLIEKNIIHSNNRGNDSVDRTIIVSKSWDGYADNTTISENIFYSYDKGGFDMTSSTNNFFLSNWYLGKCSSIPEDKNAKTESSVYNNSILKCDDKGYYGLRRLMSEHEICGNTFFLVDKKKIEFFFRSIINE